MLNFQLVIATTLCFVLLDKFVDCDSGQPKIAIIGAGLSGLGSCHYLREAFGADAEIYLFEEAEVGGRIRSIQLGDHHFELGNHLMPLGSVYLSHLIKRFELNTTILQSDAQNHFWDGKSSSSEMQFELDVSAAFTLLLRYGFDMHKVVSFTHEVYNKLFAVYRLQEDGHAYTNLTGLLRSIDRISGSKTSLFEMLSSSAKTIFKEENLNLDFLKEVVQALALQNVGQSVEKMNFFQAMGSISDAILGGYSIVAGGASKLTEKLLGNCRPKLIKAKVAKVEKVQHTAITYNLLDQSGAILLENAKFVVVAAMQTATTGQIQYNRFDMALPCVRYFVTIVEAELNKNTFDFAAPDEIQNVLTWSTEAPFFSIERMYDVNGSYPDGKSYYKVVAKSELSVADLDKVFRNATVLRRNNRIEAPNYRESLRMFDDDSDGDLGRFQVDENFFYTSPIKLMQSTLENRLIAAKNVALLIENAWKEVPNRTDRLDLETDTSETFKDEL